VDLYCLNPGNVHLNNLNVPVLNVLISCIVPATVVCNIFLTCSIYRVLYCFRFTECIKNSFQFNSQLNSTNIITTNLVLPVSFIDKKFEEDTYSVSHVRKEGWLDLYFHSTWIDFLIAAHTFLSRNHEHVLKMSEIYLQRNTAIGFDCKPNLHAGFSRQLMRFVPSFQNQSKKTLRTPRNSTCYMQLPTIIRHVHKQPETAIDNSGGAMLPKTITPPFRNLVYQPLHTLSQ